MWPDEGLKRKIECLLDIFAENIYSSEGFCWTEFDVNWQPLISEVSYGHDIETSWLLKETLDICQIKNEKIEQMTLKLAEYVLEHGLDEYGALYNHYHFQTKKTDRTRVWWVQAEAVVGFYHAYQITGDETFLAAANKVWLYIQTFFIDKRSNSEWFSRLDAHNQILSSKLENDGSSLEPISDSWKGPYHTVRMYIEIIERLGGKGNDGME
ncbi:AGE family epimerase/isomerase [Jeotgalibaca caeni]|uniref:AGE family epimerase/isomerase n=1 Tax=Jeotgalibaca caeni TaxID=3028623 RepID=UPI00237D34DC|nr:AGE family epimerase/isomerase [Jeotgalibaca caeni]MDE1549966.1 AGE family epimerase/isomerase [Jeotgalibaca caeni]